VYTDDRALVPIFKIWRAVSNVHFRNFINSPLQRGGREADGVFDKAIEDCHCEEQSDKAIQHNYQQSLCKLSSKNHLYIDLRDRDSEEFCSLFDLIEQFLEIQNLEQLLELVRSIDLNRVCSAEMIANTDIIDSYSNVIVNIETIESFGIVSDWSEIFGTRERIVVSLLRFFLEYLKPAMIKYQSDARGQIEFLSLVDTRNIVYDKFILLHAVEGTLPMSKSIDFLFNEKQREAIGLKTYDEIRLREKYYFFRLLLTSTESHIFYVENEDDNIYRSTFLEEIDVYMGESVKHHECVDSGYEGVIYKENHPPLTLSIWRGITGGNNTPSTGCHPSVEENLQVETIKMGIKADFSTDFREPYTIELSVSGYSELVADPFKWFIDYNLEYHKISLPVRDRLNHKSLGIFTHGYIEQIINELGRGGKSVSLGMFRTALHESNFEEKYRDYVKRELYRFPHESSGRYFEKVLVPAMQRNLKKIFCTDTFHNLHGDSIIHSELSVPKKVFLQTDRYKVNLSGRLDLVIYDQYADDNYIIDFKTGTHSPTQLTLYNWLLSSSGDKKFTSVYVNPIINEVSTQVEKDEKITDLTIKLREVLDKCIELGWLYEK
jgi:hypothetical protein